MQHFIKKLFIYFVLLVTLSPLTSFGAILSGDGDEARTGIDEIGTALEGSGITGTASFGDLIIKYVNFALPYLTLAAFVGFVYAGFLYVTAFGREEQLEKAKKVIIWSAVGIILVMSAFAIVQFLTGSLLGSL